MFSLALVAGLAIAQADLQPAASRLCPGAEHHRFDYLIGDWRVVETTNGKDFLHNRVESIHGGCGIREHLRMRGGVLGTTTTFLHPTENLWHSFIHDSLGFYAHLTGNTNAEGRQDLSADVRFPNAPKPDRVRKARQVTVKDEAGRPRQIGYLLNETDLTWQELYDVTFCPIDRRDPRHKPPC